MHMHVLQIISLANEVSLYMFCIQISLSLNDIFFKAILEVNQLKSKWVTLNSNKIWLNHHLKI